MKPIENLQNAMRLMSILAVAEKDAMTSVQVAELFFNKRGAGKEGREALSTAETRKIQRYLKSLSEPINGQPPILHRLADERGDEQPQKNHKSYRYYHRPSTLNKWLLSEKAALDIILAQQILGRSFGTALAEREQETDKTESIDPLALAESVAAQDTETLRLRACLRVVPDWFGRIPAVIDPSVLKEVLKAIATDRKLRFDHTSEYGVVKRDQLVSPRGLIAKDWTIYLLSTTGLSDPPGRALALHRMTSASCSHLPRDKRTVSFDLDAFIEKTHQLSHTLSENADQIELRLRVAPETIYHFRERKLSNDQVISEPTDSDSWYWVSASVVNTTLLVPFLLSMGGWIEVIEPKDVRDELAKRVGAMAAHYVA